MGDKPDPVENPHSCPLLPYANGKAPDSITVVISGVSKGVDWDSSFPEPFNGSFLCTFNACGSYSFTNSELIIVAAIGDVITSVGVRTVPYTSQFGAGNPTTEPWSADNAAPSQNIYSGGSASIEDMGLSGYMPPPSWDAANLFGVPRTPGYFAEEFPSTKANRYMRYAAHADGTNLKVWTE